MLDQDVVFVGGGNTKSMLAVWRDWRLPEVLKEAAAAGVVLAGVSAGAICWFEQGVTDSWAARLEPLPSIWPSATVGPSPRRASIFRWS